jgi:hypothetical protein
MKSGTDAPNPVPIEIAVNIDEQRRRKRLAATDDSSVDESRHA